MVDYYSPLILSFTASNTGDQYFVVGNSGVSGSAVESQKVTTFYDSYDAEGLFILVNVNGDSSNRPITLRNTGVDTSLSATMTASTTGLFQDNVNTATIAPGDTMTILVDRSNTNTVAIRALGLWLKSTQPVNKVSVPSFAFSIANATRYMQVPGTGSLEAAEDIRHRIVLPVDCTIQNFYAYLFTNPRTTVTTATLRKNGADTAATFTIPASTSGIFEDTTNIISYTAGDDYSVKLVTLAGSGAMNFGQLGFDIINDDTGSFTQIKAGLASALSNTTVNRDTALGGRLGLVSSATLATTQIPMRGASKLRKFRLAVLINTSTISTTIDLEINGALAGLSLTIPPTVTGEFSDLSTEIDISDGDLINLYSLGSAGTGSKVISWMSYEIDQFVTPPAGAGGVQSLMFWY